jgi:hypothetical protein
MKREIIRVEPFPNYLPARNFIDVPAWNGGFDIEVDWIAAL